jgi:hypothetical protein
MRKSILLFLFLTIIIYSGAMAGGLELKPYGFIKGDMVYATKGVLSFGGSSLASSQIASGVDYSAIGFTAMHTRFGFKGTTGDAIKVGGMFELDFFGGGFDANIKPRIRLAYASMATGNLELRFGQQWDLYSPINASTNNTNGNMWYAGNRGFRRAQIQVHYKLGTDGLSPLLQLSVGEGAKEVSALGADNLSGIPMIQGRFSAKLMEKNEIGVYFVYAKHDPDPENDDDEYNTSGFGVDFNFPFSPQFALKGEFNMGTNLSNCDLFNIAGSGSKDDDRKVMGVWLNALSKPSSKVNFVAGFGMDKNQTDNLAAGAQEQNTVVYGDIIFPFDHGFSIALEVQSISTKIKDGDTNSALVFNISGKIGF